MTATMDRRPDEVSAEPGDVHAAAPVTRRRPPTHRTGMPAGRALQIMVGALLTAMVFNSASMVRAGEGMHSSFTRTMILAVARPVDAVAHALWLDRPQRVLGWAFGGDGASRGSSPLLSAPTSTPATAPSGQPSGQPAPSSPLVGAPPTRVPSAAAPLKLLITGDSMTEFLGPALISASSAGGKVAGRTVTRYGTGLVRPDFFDWAREAKRLMQAQSPEAVVVMMGGNDGQGIRLPSGTVLPDGSPQWAAEYQRRAGIVMRTFTAGGARRVYWISMPVARSARLARDYAQLNGALAVAAADVPGARYVDVATRLSKGGRYSDHLPNDAGHTVLARARDGIHLTRDGARIAAALALRPLHADWHL